MKISVVLPTARYGGFDVLCHSMWDQTMNWHDYEVIVIDELWEQRQGLLAGQLPNITHARPDKKSDVYDNSSGFNSALRRATGELIVFLVDYMWVPKDYLQRHWDYHTSHQGWSLTGYLDRYEFPQLESRPGFSLLFSIFEEEFDKQSARELFYSREPVYRERKGGAGIIHSDGKVEMPGDKIYLIPDSIPLTVLKEIGGLDTRYDGGYG